MLVLVIGGSASGKSAFAEDIAESIRDRGGNKYYLAFMKNDSEAAAKRIERHRMLRQGKGFVTLEIPCDVDTKLPETFQKTKPYEYTVETSHFIKAYENRNCYVQIEDIPRNHHDSESYEVKCHDHDTVLMESVGVLLANEMFKDGGLHKDAGKYVLEELLKASEYFENAVIVAEDVFSDGNDYDEYSRKYIEALGSVNRGLAEKADAVAEVVCSYPLWIKGCNHSW